MRILTLKNAPGLDYLGIAASCACAAHCILAPPAIAALPILGLSLFVDAKTEWMFVGLSVVFGGLSLVPAYVKRHRRCKPLLLFAGGLLLLLLARLWLDEELQFEIPIVIVAAVLIVTSHLTNLRLCQSCPTCTDGS